jgi:adhesin/invasin
VAGTGKAGFNGDDQPATEAQLNFPTGIFVDKSGNIYMTNR